MPDRIYNMNETGLLYRCLPSRSYVPRKDRRRARGTKAMRHMDRVTLVLCTNATGIHKLPVAMIGEAAKPLCFRGDGNDVRSPTSTKEGRGWTNSSTLGGGILCSVRRCGSDTGVRNAL